MAGQLTRFLEQQTAQAVREQARIGDSLHTKRAAENATHSALQAELAYKSRQCGELELAVLESKRLVEMYGSDAVMNSERRADLEREVALLKGRAAEMVATLTQEKAALVSGIETQLSSEKAASVLLTVELARLEKEVVTLREEARHKGEEARQKGEMAAEMELKAKHYAKKAKEAKRTTLAACKSMTPALSNLRAMHSSLKREATASMGLWKEMVAEMSTAVKRLHNIDLVAAATTVQDHMSLLTDRKKLLNYIQELRGNIRVYCRIRPMWANEEREGVASVIAHSDAEEISLQHVDEVDGKLTKKGFEFDHVFESHSTQEEVFIEIMPMIQSALDGYNICIFAYGQTGSGKTFTMQGPGDGPDRGVTYRVLEELFRLKDDAWAGVEYSFHLSMLEIYNEQVIDILDEEPVKLKKGDLITMGEKKKTCEIKMDPSGTGIIVQGLFEKEVSTKGEVLALMGIGQKNRSVAATAMNSSSSRSHLAVTIKIAAHNRATDVTRHSKINLIDLAGSERVNRSEVAGARLKEAQAINKSLSCLGDVIYSLGSKSGHVPFRNSKLTHLLSDSLGGNSKVLMFVNISPTALSFQETVSSLQFATRVRSVSLGTAKRAKTGERSTPENGGPGAASALLNKPYKPVAPARGGAAPPPPPPPPGPPREAPQGGRGRKKKK